MSKGDIQTDFKVCIQVCMIPRTELLRVWYYYVVFIYEYNFRPGNILPSWESYICRIYTVMIPLYFGVKIISLVGGYNL